MQHTFVLSDLTPGKTYQYQIKSTSDNNLQAQSQNLTFQTPKKVAETSVLEIIVKTLQNALSSFTSWLKK
jgi:surfactin synthase thioesterase subunit